MTDTTDPDRPGPPAAAGEPDPPPARGDGAASGEGQAHGDGGDGQGDGGDEERARTLEVLRDHLLRHLAAAPVSVALVDPRARLVAWSARWLDDHGLDARTLAGRRLDEVLPGQPERWRADLRRALAGEVVRHAEDRFERPDGRRPWLRRELHPVRSGQGAVAGLLVFTEDVTDRRESLRSLRDTEERLSMAAAAGFGGFDVDVRSGEVTWSEEALAAAGIEEWQVPHSFEDWAAVLSEDDMARLAECRRAAFDPLSGGRISVEVWVHGARGPRRVQILGHVHFEGRGATRHPVRIVGVVTDQTEAHRTRELLAQSQRVETVGRLAGVVAHDFNNLLSVIQANLDLAEMQASDDGLRQLLARAREATEMGASFNRRLLSLVGGREVRPQPIRPVARLAETHALLARALGEGVTLRFEAQPGTWPVLIDPGELDGAVLNLSVNARDALPRGGVIVLATANRTLTPEQAARHPGARPGDHVRISVADAGVGMAPEVAARALDPFFSTKAPGRGTGLGLTSVASVAARAGGFVEIETAAGVGTTVAIWLPRHRGPTLAEDADPEALPMGDGELVLVVEDDGLVREATLRRLEVLGYAVIEAADADQALRLMEAGEPVDLVLSDVVMPGSMSGHDLVQAIAARWPGVGLLLASGYASLHGARPSGGPELDFLAKPYSLQVLARAVRRALRARAAPSARPRPGGRGDGRDRDPRP